MREIMRKILFAIIFGAAVLATASCSFFEIDNFAQPEETLKGVVVDKATGEPVLTAQASEGIRVRLTELSYGDNVEHNPDFYCREDGTFQNTKLFKGHYNIRVDGPFIPLLIEDAAGNVVEDNTIYADIKGVTQVRFEVQPFLKVEFVGEPVVSSGKVTAQVKVSRAVSTEEFQAKMEQAGAWDPACVNVTDVRLFVSYSSTCNERSDYEAWSGSLQYGGASFEDNLGKPITISSKGTIKSNRKIFIRAAARINYATANVRRYNYSEILEVNIPE